MENMETIKQPIILGKIAQIDEMIDRLEDILSPVLISGLDIEKEEANSEPPKSTAIRNIDNCVIRLNDLIKRIDINF